MARPLIHANNFKTTLSSAITSTGATTMTVTSTTGAPTVSSTVPCNFTITDGTNYEIVTATSLSSSTYTITRGAESTTAQTWALGATVEINCTAASLDNKLDAPASPTAYALYCGGTTTNTLAQQVANGSAGQYLQYNGSSSLPTWVTGNGILNVSASGVGSIAYTNGTNWTMLSTSSSATRYLSNTGASNVPAWAQINLTNGVTGILPTANMAGWDTNNNHSANAYIPGYATTATSAGTTTLTVTSAQDQFFTGSTTQNCKLPVTSTLANGQIFNITNLSTGAITVQSSGANTIIVLPANTEASMVCISTSGTDATSWSCRYRPVANNLIIKSQIIESSAVSLTTSTATNLTSISLPDAGQWDIFGNITFVATSSTVVSFCLGAINTASATLPDPSLYGLLTETSPGTWSALRDSPLIPARTFDITTATTVYLIAYASFTTSTMAASGNIYARRR